MKQALRQEREQRGWTQADVAARASISKQMVCDMEAGRRKPSYEVLVKLEDLFGMNHRELFAAVDGDSSK